MRERERGRGREREGEREREVVCVMERVGSDLSRLQNEYCAKSVYSDLTLEKDEEKKKQKGNETILCVRHQTYF